MRLKPLVQRYLKNRRSMGVKLERTERQLNAFCNAVGDIDVSKVDPLRVRAYLDGKGPLTSNWHRKHEAVSGLYRYAISRGFATTSPLPTEIPIMPKTFVAYTYSANDFQVLLKAVDDYGRPQNRFTSLSYRTLLILLFNTGLRIGEALSLKIADVDLVDNMIVVQDSKFFKSRLIPIGAKLSKALSHYILVERQAILPFDPDATYFVERNGRPYGQAGARNRFRRLCNRVKIQRPTTSRYQPRLHDIRHTFAITRLRVSVHEGHPFRFDGGRVFRFHDGHLFRFDAGHLFRFHGGRVNA